MALVVTRSPLESMWSTNMRASEHRTFPGNATPGNHPRVEDIVGHGTRDRLDKLILFWER